MKNKIQEKKQSPLSTILTWKRIKGGSRFQKKATEFTERMKRI